MHVSSVLYRSTPPGCLYVAPSTCRVVLSNLVCALKTIGRIKVLEPRLRSSRERDRNVAAGQASDPASGFRSQRRFVPKATLVRALFEPEAIRYSLRRPHWLVGAVSGTIVPRSLLDLDPYDHVLVTQRKLFVIPLGVIGDT